MTPTPRQSTYYERTAAQRLDTRRTLATWQRDRQVQIIAELDALRQDLARLRRLATQVARCDRCHILNTVTIQESGFWLCRRCQIAKENNA